MIYIIEKKLDDKIILIPLFFYSSTYKGGKIEKNKIKKSSYSKQHKKIEIKKGIIQTINREKHLDNTT